MNKQQKLTKLKKIAVENGYQDIFNVPPYSVEDIVFMHDFAKAFWGTIYVSASDGGIVYGDERYLENWQYHLQQCVISDDFVEYYWKNIPGNKDPN